MCCARSNVDITKEVSGVWDQVARTFGARIYNTKNAMNVNIIDAAVQQDDVSSLWMNPLVGRSWEGRTYPIVGQRKSHVS